MKTLTLLALLLISIQGSQSQSITYQQFCNINLDETLTQVRAMFPDDTLYPVASLTSVNISVYRDTYVIIVKNNPTFPAGFYNSSGCLYLYLTFAGGAKRDNPLIYKALSQQLQLTSSLGVN